MNVLFQLHSLMRWLVLLAGVIALVRAAWGWVSNLPFEKPDNILGAAFTGLLDLNVVIGIVVLIDRWGTLTRQEEIHPVMMLLAAIVAHVARRLARKQEAKGKHLSQGAGVLVSFILILIGIQFVT